LLQRFAPLMPRSAGEMAVGSLLMTLSVAVLADRRSPSIDVTGH